MTEDNPQLRRRIGQFVTLRDKIQEMDKAHELAVKPFKDVAALIQNEILAHLNAVGAQSVSTPDGTAYKNRVTNVSMVDSKMFRDYLLQEGCWELADLRPNKVGVDNFMSMNEGRLPPGVNLTAAFVANVRRPSNKD